MLGQLWTKIGCHRRQTADPTSSSERLKEDTQEANVEANEASREKKRQLTASKGLDAIGVSLRPGRSGQKQSTGENLLLSPYAQGTCKSSPQIVALDLHVILTSRAF